MQSTRHGLAFAGTLLLATTAFAQSPVVINEVYYDAPGSDDGQVFVELYGPAGFDIGGWSILGVEQGFAPGGCNSQSFTFPPGTTIPGDGFVVVADELGTTGTTLVANADFIVNNMDLENGADGVILCDNGGRGVLDSVNYGSTVNTAHNCSCAIGAPFEGNPARDVFAPLSIERCPAGADTNDNDADFTPTVPTPGTGQKCCGAIEWVSQPTPTVGGIPTLTVFNGDKVGLDVWFSCSAGQPFLLLWSATGPAPGTVPVVLDPLTDLAATLANIPPFVGWAGVLDGNGRRLGSALLDFSGFAGMMWPAPLSTWIGGVSLAPGIGLVGTGIAVQVDVN